MRGNRKGPSLRPAGFYHDDRLFRRRRSTTSRRSADELYWKASENYRSTAVSGATALRPGYQALLSDARGKRFDIVVAESLDRFSRDQEHIASFYKLMSFAGISVMTVAEGIETAVAANRLREFGCDIAQGYFYAKPMSGEALEAWLKGRSRVPIIAVPIAFAVDDVTDTVSLATF